MKTQNYQLSYTRNGKHTTKHVKRDVVNFAKQQIKNFRRFKELTDEWVDLSTTAAKMRKAQQKI